LIFLYFVLKASAAFTSSSGEGFVGKYDTFSLLSSYIPILRFFWPKITI